jgi:hypothetical protein
MKTRLAKNDKFTLAALGVMDAAYSMRNGQRGTLAVIVSLTYSCTRFQGLFDAIRIIQNKSRVVENVMIKDGPK